jgi:protease I
MKKALVVVAQNGFQPIEYSDTRKELENSGISVIVASLKKGEAAAKDGSRIKVDIAISDAKSNDYDAIVLIGGPGAARDLVGNSSLIRLVKDFEKAGKIVAAICIAPIVLAQSEILKGKNATVWDGDGRQSALFEKSGINYTGEDVTADRKIITANGPMAAKKFGAEIAKAIV